jgi:molybdate transport system ATP-binding protein
MTLSVDIRHAFGDFTLDVSFEAPPGLTVLFGRSGSGKSTVINAVAGLLSPDTGRITVEGKTLFDRTQGIDLAPHRRGLGYVFQEGRLFPHMTVRQNLMFSRWFRKGARSDFHEVVEMLGIGALLDRRPVALSGGEKQRVAIGRALLGDPRIILADEPLAALDEPRKAEILPYFERLRDEVSVPILYVSHSATEVARLATTVVTLENGRVTGQGPATGILGDPMLTPLGARAAGAVLETKVARHHDDGLTELSAGGVALFVPRVAQQVGQPLRIRIAAQEVILSRTRPEGLSALNILPGQITTIRSGAGPGALVSVATPAGILLARITQRSARLLDLTEGASCYAIVKSVAIAPEDVGGPDRVSKAL